jgi:hypothetical protein
VAVMGLVWSTDYYVRLDVADFGKKMTTHLFYLISLVVRVTVRTACNDMSIFRPGKW